MSDGPTGANGSMWVGAPRAMPRRHQEARRASGGIRAFNGNGDHTGHLADTSRDGRYIDERRESNGHDCEQGNRQIEPGAEAENWISPAPQCHTARIVSRTRLPASARYTIEHECKRRTRFSSTAPSSELAAPSG
jgi:hypothetical protein